MEISQENANNNNDSNDVLNALITSGPPIIDWTIEHEHILIEWADKSMCYRWLHSKSNALFDRLNALYTIPCIIISTLAGTANFAQQRVPEEYQPLFTMVVGGINILGGIISTIQQFLKITQLNEAHRVSSIAWDKFYRNIKIELTKHPNERIHPTQMLKMCKEEFDRLMETSPTIPDEIIKLFKKSFKQNDDFHKISKPEICDILISTESFRNPWFNEENVNKRNNDIIKAENIKLNYKKKIDETNINLLKDFKKTFNDLHHREPLDSEIIDNLNDKIDVSILIKLIEESKIHPLDIV